MFGMTPPKPTSAQPRLVMHQKRPEDVNSLVLPLKSTITTNGSVIKESRPPNFIGPVQVVANGKHSGSSAVKDKPNALGILKLSDNVSCSQNASIGKAYEPEKKNIGPLVPYDYDDDSSSRDSSLSPPLNDDQEVLTVKATTPSDWQVTNSSGLRSPSIHSESSNHSVASTTGTNWNVTEKQSLTGSKSVSALKVNDRKLKEHTPQTICSSSDIELESQTVNSAGKCNLQAKSVERELNIDCNATSSNLPLLNKKVRVRRSSLSSESDSSASSKLLKKKAKV